MAKQFSAAYTLLFVGAVALGCSLLLSLTATALKGRQTRNIELDVKKNILKCFRVAVPEGEDLSKYFTERIEEVVVDATGKVVPGVAADAVKPEEEEKKPSADRLLPVYVLRGEPRPEAYAIPIFGKGLWSTLYGYLSLQSDLDTVRGITFYQHGETPGLGGEIENEQWQQSFADKRILDDQDRLRSITVVKGKAAEKFAGNPSELRHAVEGSVAAAATADAGAAVAGTGEVRAEHVHFRSR